MEIDETKLPESLFVTGEDGKKTLDLTRIKSQADVDAVLQAKEHVKTDFNAFKEKFKNVDINKYNSLISNELEQNKDILANPVYKNLEGQYNTLKGQMTELQQQIEKRNQDIFDSELKDSFRKIKGIQETAIDDVLFRAKQAGFTKTEKGILDKNGITIDSFAESLKSSAPHLFKKAVGANDSERLQNLASAVKNNSLTDVLKSCPTITK